MTIRIMLVGLVASLGFELPIGSDLSRWAQAGADWVHGRIEVRSGPEVEPKLDLAGPSDCQQADPKFEVPSLISVEDSEADRAFQAVSEGMAADLSADLLASHRDEVSAPEVGLTLAADETTPVGFLEEKDAGCLVLPADEASGIEASSTVEDTPDDSIETTEASTARFDRVSDAVRLTREAVQAWAGLILQSDEECHPTR